MEEPETIKIDEDLIERHLRATITIIEGLSGIIKTTEVFRLMKDYPIRPDGSINLSIAAIRKLGWPEGCLCKIMIDFTNDQFIIQRADTPKKERG